MHIEFYGATSGLSAHADAEDLMRWMRNFKSHPRVHVVHGEPEAKQAFRDRLAENCTSRSTCLHRATCSNSSPRGPGGCTDGRT